MSNVENINILGGIIDATGIEGGAGIGSGVEGNVGNILISSGVVNAISNFNDPAMDLGAGIGTGTAGKAKSITISGNAKVVATGAAFASGIGRGYNMPDDHCDPFPISIKDNAEITAFAVGNFYSQFLQDDGDSFLSAIDLECANLGTHTAKVIMGDFKTVPNGAGPQTINVFNKTLVLPVEYASFAVTTSEDIGYIKLGNDHYMGDLTMKNESNLTDKFSNAKLGINAYWMLQPSSTRIYTVEFDSNGGTLVESLKNVDENTTISSPDNPKKNNYIFEGWYSDKKLTNRWDFANDKVTKDTVLYAKWKEVARPNDPSTGDNTNTLFYAMTMMISAIGFTMLVIRKKEKQIIRRK